MISKIRICYSGEMRDVESGNSGQHMTIQEAGEAFARSLEEQRPLWLRLLCGKKKVPIQTRLLRGGIVLTALLSLITTTAWLYLAQPTPAHSEPSAASVDPAVLEAHVRKLSEDFVPRSLFHIGNTKRTADYLRTQLDEAVQSKGRTQSLWFGPSGERQRNVSLVLAPQATGKRIVIGAHYDAYREFPGADDNASGVAGLIELARLLGRVENRLTRPIELVGYPQEEPPVFATKEMGSAHHARELKNNGVDIQLMICLEMIGYFTDERGSQDYPVPGLSLFYPNRGNFIVVVGNTEQRDFTKAVKVSMKGSTPLPVYSISASPSLPGIDFSDHRNYWELGYPAVMITDTAFYRNKAYHTPNDTADRLDYSKMGMVVIGVYEAVLDLATSPSP